MPDQNTTEKINERIARAEKKLGVKAPGLTKEEKEKRWNLFDIAAKQTVFGAEIARRRKEIGMTQLGLAKHADYSIDYIKKIEIGIIDLRLNISLIRKLVKSVKWTMTEALGTLGRSMNANPEPIDIDKAMVIMKDIFLDAEEKGFEFLHRAQLLRRAFFGQKNANNFQDYEKANLEIEYVSKIITVAPALLAEIYIEWAFQEKVDKKEWKAIFEKQNVKNLEDIQDVLSGCIEKK